MYGIADGSLETFRLDVISVTGGGGPYAVANKRFVDLGPLDKGMCKAEDGEERAVWLVSEDPDENRELRGELDGGGNDTQGCRDGVECSARV